MTTPAGPPAFSLNALSDSWTRLWHQPLRAERLGLMRLCIGLALLGEQLVEFLPNLPVLYGPEGIAPDGARTSLALGRWRWATLFFYTDDLFTVYVVFWLWAFFAAAFAVGFFTRASNVAVWLLTMAFVNRTRFLLNGGNDMLQAALFLLMFSPSGQALSVDAWLRHRLTRRPGDGDSNQAYVAAWPVRLIQFQLCIVYFSTGLLKLKGYPGLFMGTWYEGSSVHYALNIVDRARWAYCQFPLPFWLTACLTYATLAWEALFPFLLFTRPTRWLALGFGVLFHVGICCSIEVGWFGYYALCYYAVWTPDEFWAWLDGKPAQATPAPKAT